MSTHCLLQEYGFLLKKHPILKTDCNLQAAFSFNNNNFLFQWMLQCALTDHCFFLRLGPKHDWTCCFGRFLGWWTYIYIYTYVYLSIILKSCYDDIAQSMLFCLCTTGLFFFQGRHQQLQTSSGFAAAGCLSCEDGWILPNQTWEISKVRQILLAPQWDMDISVQKRPKSQSHCLFFKWLDNTCFVQKYLGEEVRLFAWSREHNFQETRNS